MWKWADDKTKGRGSWNWVPGPSPLFITWHGRFSRDSEIFAGKGRVTRQRGVLLWQVTGDHYGQVRCCRYVCSDCLCMVLNCAFKLCGITMCSCSWESSLDYYHLIDSPPLERRLSHPDYKAGYWEYWEQHWDLAEKWCPPEWLGGDLLQFMIGICSGHCRRRHWAASTFNCKLLVLALSSFVLGTLGGFWFPFKSWTKWFCFL